MAQLLNDAFQIGSLVLLFFILRALEKIIANQQRHMDIVWKMRSPAEVHRCMYGEELP
jgi:hypothetical protein